MTAKFWFVCRFIKRLNCCLTASREPNPETIPATERTVPHHAAEGSSLAHTSHIILYQEGGKREPLLKYKMDHVKTLPLTWFKQSVFHHQLLSPDVYFQ